MKPETLLNIAEEALRNAYCPYSNYAVGAALACADGRVITGVNVENASYGLTTCAERNALFAAVGKGKRDFAELAVVAKAPEPDGSVPRPCGACLQALSEFCGKDFRIYTARSRAIDKYETLLLEQLLPRPFSIDKPEVKR
ncbi:MAG: cytidine deaminase [Kiritimatiellia bacterium]